MSTPKKSVLGKGLGALLDTSDVVRPVAKPIHSGVSEIDIDKIEANPNQPRSRFDEESLLELADNIKQIGLIQPITVREVSPDKYQIISGERRWRASKLIELKTIPAYVRKTNDEDVLLLALVENVQREDLDAIEIAVTYQRLIDECNLTHDQLSEKVSKPRATITNYLRLLKLPPEIQAGIINRDLTMGHAKALISVDDYDFQVKLYTDIISQDLSVRRIEELVRDFQTRKNSGLVATDEKGKIVPNKTLPPEYVALQDQLSDIFKSKIKLKKSPQGKGEIVIPFQTEDDFERLIHIIEKIQA